MIRKTLFIFLTCIFAASCASNKKIVYVNTGHGEVSTNIDYANVLQPDDNIIITVTADEPELANPYNLMFLNLRSNELRTVNNEALYTYLLDQNGEIDFPVLGKIKLSGLTRIEAENKIKSLLKDELVNPGVNLRVVNFKISVLGEVARPGLHQIPGDRITLLEAISLSGDLTIYGKRKDITVIREKDGTKTISEVDITNPDFINSPYYYLDHNDVVYVKPNKTKVNSSVIGPNLTVGISAISLLVTIIALSTR